MQDVITMGNVVHATDIRSLAMLVRKLHIQNDDNDIARARTGIMTRQIPLPDNRASRLRAQHARSRLPRMSVPADQGFSPLSSYVSGWNMHVGASWVACSLLGLRSVIRSPAHGKIVGNVPLGVHIHAQLTESEMQSIDDLPDNVRSLLVTFAAKQVILETALSALVAKLAKDNSDSAAEVAAYLEAVKSAVEDVSQRVPGNASIQAALVTALKNYNESILDATGVVLPHGVAH